MGPIEADLRRNASGMYPATLSYQAARVFDCAHRDLERRHGEVPVYPGCCLEAFSEAIEAAEALGL